MWSCEPTTAEPKVLNAFFQLDTFTPLLLDTTAHICFLAILVQCLNIMHVKKAQWERLRDIGLVLTLDQEAEALQYMAACWQEELNVKGILFY